MSVSAGVLQTMTIHALRSPKKTRLIPIEEEKFHDDNQQTIYKAIRQLEEGRGAQHELIEVV